MGVQGRDYMRERKLPFSASGSRAVWWIIGINVLLWVFAAGSQRTQGPFGSFIYFRFTLIPEAVLSGEVWRLFTAIWVHTWNSASHVLLNMLLLFFLGRWVEQRLGSRQFTRLYVLCGLASTVVLTVFYLSTQKSFIALGASGAVYGVLTWRATVAPHHTVLLFGVIPMPMWVLVGVLMIGGEVVGLGDATRPMEPILGHLAGAACGFAMARFGSRYERPRTKRKKRSRSAKPTRPPASRPAPDPNVRLRVDALLKKIHDEGIAALTEAEKQFLQEASQRYR